jgi:tripartite-type tricarboxylate transporter receptor subunit TctC
MRKTLLRSAAVSLVLACALAAPQVRADKYPYKPIRIIQGFSIGGISDTLARMIGDKLGARLGQPIVVEARPGAGGIVGMSYVSESAPDGYTLLLGNSAITIMANRKERLPFDPMKTFVPVSMIGTAPSVLLAHTSLPVESIADLIAYAKARPGKVDCATSGVGTTNDLGVHLLNYMAKIQISTVPYKGSGPSIIAALSNETSLSFSPLLPAIPHVKSGRLKALGMSSERRNPALPKVPAIAETVPGYEAVGFFSIVAHRSVPRQVVELLHRHINEILEMPDMQERLVEQGLEVKVMTRAAFAEFMLRDAERWKNLVTQARVVF